MRIKPDLDAALTTFGKKKGLSSRAQVVRYALRQVIPQKCYPPEPLVPASLKAKRKQASGATHRRSRVKP